MAPVAILKSKRSIDEADFNKCTWYQDDENDRKTTIQDLNTRVKTGYCIVTITILV